MASWIKNLIIIKIIILNHHLFHIYLITMNGIHKLLFFLQEIQFFLNCQSLILQYHDKLNYNKPLDKRPINAQHHLLIHWRIVSIKRNRSLLQSLYSTAPVNRHLFTMIQNHSLPVCTGQWLYVVFVVYICRVKQHSRVRHYDSDSLLNSYWRLRASIWNTFRCMELIRKPRFLKPIPSTKLCWFGICFVLFENQSFESKKQRRRRFRPIIWSHIRRDIITKT